MTFQTPSKYINDFRIRMSVRRNFEIGWKFDALDDCRGLCWVPDQDDDLCTFEHRVLPPYQFIRRYDLHDILRDAWHGKAECQSCKGK